MVRTPVAAIVSSPVSPCRSRPLRCAALALLLAVAGALPSAASAAGEAAACFHDKMRASRVGSLAWLRCGAKGDEASPRNALCLAKADARVRAQLLSADWKASNAGFLCPGNAETLGLGGPLVWPLRLLDQTGTGPGRSCRRLRAGALRRLAKDYALCVEQEEAAPSFDYPLCEAVARTNFTKAWQRSAGDCDPVDADLTADAVEAEIDETASRVRVRCGDGRVGGFEDCDDGANTDGDGCSADCRTEGCTAAGDQQVCSVCTGDCGPETCARVGGEVRCVACPADSVPTADHLACRCSDGYAGEPGACTDIDECSQPVDPCAGLGPCVNRPGTWSCATACSADAFHAALAACGAPSGTIVFDCADTVIPLPGGAAPGLRDTSCSDLTIDGAGRGITFELAPQCWQTPLDASLCPGGLEPDGTCPCPNVDSGDAFLVLRGDRNVVRDLTVRGFFEGVHTRGAGNLVEGVRFERQCDDSFGNGPGGRGNVFRDLVVRDGCDKCSESTGALADTDPDPRVPEHYNALLERVDFDNCLTPVRVSSAGRYLLDGVTMKGGNAEFPCDGPRFSSTGPAGDLVVEIRDSSLTGCRRGLRLGASTDAVVRDSVIRGCALRGIRAAATSRLSVEGTTIFGNGGSQSSETGFGGVVAVDGAVVDLGGGSVVIDGVATTSAGGNSICDNLDATGARLDLASGTPEAVAGAAGNWWCTLDPLADRIAGPAVVDPVLTRAPDSWIAP